MGGFAGPDTMDDTRTAGDLRVVRSSLGGSYARLASGAFPTGELVELEAYCNAALGDRPDGWSPSRVERASKAPELIVQASADDAVQQPDPPPSVGWWPW